MTKQEWLQERINNAPSNHLYMIRTGAPQHAFSYAENQLLQYKKELQDLLSQEADQVASVKEATKVASVKEATIVLASNCEDTLDF